MLKLITLLSKSYVLCNKWSQPVCDYYLAYIKSYS